MSPTKRTARFDGRLPPNHAAIRRASVEDLVRWRECLAKAIRTGRPADMPEADYHETTRWIEELDAALAAELHRRTHQCDNHASEPGRVRAAI